MNDFTVYEESKAESMRQCHQSWLVITDLLHKHNPKLWENGGKTGEENALIEIRRLQALEKPHKRSRKIKTNV